jgi:hypothetical protein
MAVSGDQELVGGVTHFTSDGVSRAGGSVAGARRDCVRSNTEDGRFGGITKCNASSLRMIFFRMQRTKVYPDSHANDEIADIQPRTPF